MEFATRDVYFSRADGHPLRFYIRTLDGYKFAAAPGTDPVYGINYQPITAAVAKEYLLWQKRGGKMQDPGRTPRSRAPGCRRGPGGNVGVVASTGPRRSS
jgi:hypothetical protein